MKIQMNVFFKNITPTTALVKWGQMILTPLQIPMANYNGTFYD
jgi:hypothetical protein